MANVKFNKKIFEKEIGKLDEKLQEKISLFGTPIENIDDKEIEIEVYPNRPDLLSYSGFRRSFSSFIGKQNKIEYKIYPPERDYKVYVEESLKNIRPYTVCAIIKGLNFTEELIKEIIDMQEKLHMTLGRNRKKFAIGIYPLEKIKLPITFKALEPDKIKFIPLDFEKEMNGFQILQKHPKGREYSYLLTGKEKFPIFIDSNNQILSMPPIINSQLTGKVDDKTKDIFIECSGFDLNTLNKCLDIIVANLVDSKGKVYSMEVVYGKEKIITPSFKKQEIKISLDNVNSLLGLNLKDEDIRGLLKKMGYEYIKKKVIIPPWRLDILHEVDIIEDIAIAYGYDKFVPELPKISTIGEESKTSKIKNKISEILIGLNLIEVSNYHLTTKKDQFKKMSIEEKEYLEVENSKTDYNILRKNLSHYLLKVLSENSDTEYPQKIFEIGKVFDKEEKENLAVALAPANFTDIRQILEYLFRMLNLKLEIEESKEEYPYLIEGRTIDIKFLNKKIGYLGEVHPKTLNHWKIKMPVSLLEINLDEIIKNLS
jgi:phenylalanyl-tRNA synthetase beta chain